VPGALVGRHADLVETRPRLRMLIEAYAAGSRRKLLARLQAV